MKYINAIWRFLYKCGLVVFIYLIMFIGSISLVSLTQKGVIYYGDRCNSLLDNKAIDYLKQEEIIAYDYVLQCNTLYLDLNVNDELTDKQITALLVRISSYYKEIDFNVDTQITTKNSKYLILASLINHEVSLTVSQL